MSWLESQAYFEKIKKINREENIARFQLRNMQQINKKTKNWVL